MKCIDCKYFVVPANERMGSCKRYPAAVNKIVNDWCGEFFRKEMIEETVEEFIQRQDEPIKVEFKSIFPIEITSEEPVADKPKRKPRAKKDVS